MEGYLDRWHPASIKGEKGAESSERMLPYGSCGNSGVVWWCRESVPKQICCSFCQKSTRLPGLRTSRKQSSVHVRRKVTLRGSGIMRVSTFGQNSVPRNEMKNDVTENVLQAKLLFGKTEPLVLKDKKFLAIKRVVKMALFVFCY